MVSRDSKSFSLALHVVKAAKKMLVLVPLTTLSCTLV